MSFDWSEYLTLAQALADAAPASSSPEAHQRTAISRAYYAAFIQARNRLRDIERRPVPYMNVHEHIIQQFKYSRDYRRQRIGNELSILRSQRTKVDYDNIVPNLPALMDQLLDRARRIVTLLNRL